VCVCVRVCVCAGACLCVCICACICMCVCVCVYTHTHLCISCKETDLRGGKTELQAGLKALDLETSFFSNSFTSHDMHRHL